MGGGVPALEVRGDPPPPPPISTQITPVNVCAKRKIFKPSSLFSIRTYQGGPQRGLPRHRCSGTSLWSVHPLAMPNAQALAMPNAQSPPPHPKRGRPLFGGLFSGTFDFWMSCRRLSAQLLNIRAHLVQSVQSLKRGQDSGASWQHERIRAPRSPL